MALILCLETATRICSVALVRDGALINEKISEAENAHSSLLTVFIQSLMDEAGLPLQALDAVAVSRGPGSYTGLRIGVSTAKGLCFALDKPLISLPTLAVMAAGIQQAIPGAPDRYYVPMIDARRMEVYVGIYGSSLEEIQPVRAEILSPESFPALDGKQWVLAGDGAAKCRELFPPSDQFLYPELLVPQARHMAAMATAAYTDGTFEDTAYFEPYYLKDFVAGKPKVKGLR